MNRTNPHRGRVTRILLKVGGNHALPPSRTTTTNQASPWPSSSHFHASRRQSPKQEGPNRSQVPQKNNLDRHSHNLNKQYFLLNSSNNTKGISLGRHIQMHDLTHQAIIKKYKEKMSKARRRKTVNSIERADHHPTKIRDATIRVHCPTAPAYE